ncbi:MAG TPA: hypothetical protein DEQ40_04135 [Oxalobacteraceae bacterium]|nr:hypothetical protein [Oxalobacteraceae bacterium]
MVWAGLLSLPQQGYHGGNFQTPGAKMIPSATSLRGSRGQSVAPANQHVSVFLSQADTALYRAKAARKNRVEHHLQIDSDLQDPLSRLAATRVVRAVIDLSVKREKNAEQFYPLPV